MTKIEVVDIIVRDHLVEKIVFKLLPASKNPFDCPEDLIQDLYLILLNSDENLIVTLYNKANFLIEVGFWQS